MATTYRIATDATGGLAETVDVHFDDCDHDEYEYEPSDPSVGIFGELAWCLDCGATATEWDEDPDGGDPIWTPPTYLED